ncbi:hypothetical protein ACFWNL_18455 [Kitasatospora sp. NPDC058397]|uniref:hypothetical protein n=1 Tax=unclassified Kitasatospora TaxID=2633591 RepID=UPI00364810D3
MSRRDTVQQRAREFQKAEKAAGRPIRYHDALNQVRAASAGREPVAVQPTPVEQVLAIAYTRQPTPTEAAAGIIAEELGVSALPADATPEQRARAEATWRPAAPDQPCRCSGTGCHHGKLCPNSEEDGPGRHSEDGCPGQLVHTDRYPGSLWGITAWWDEYGCADCGESVGCSVVLPEIPWGERRQIEGGSGTTSTYTGIFPGVRHPNFPEVDKDDGEGDLIGDDYDDDDYDDYDGGAALDYRGAEPDDDLDGPAEDLDDDGPDPDPDDFRDDDPEPEPGYEKDLDPWPASAEVQFSDVSPVDGPDDPFDGERDAGLDWQRSYHDFPAL